MKMRSNSSRQAIPQGGPTIRRYLNPRSSGRHAAPRRASTSRPTCTARCARCAARSPSCVRCCAGRAP